MFYKRSGYPQEEEIVLCRVTKIFPNSVFAEMIEFGQSGMIHISEIAPGRIRNLREYVSVGKQIVCKVLRINQERGHIDLSLRRVNPFQQREKLMEVKQELKAEQLIKNLSTKLNTDPKKLYLAISKPIFEQYSHLHLAFKDVSKGDISLKELGVPAKVSADLEEAIKEKFKEAKVFFQGEITLKTHQAQGVEKIKKTLEKIQDLSEDIELSYLGAGRYKFIFEQKDKDIKKAEKQLIKMQKVLSSFDDKVSSSSFSRQKANIEE